MRARRARARDSVGCGASGTVGLGASGTADGVGTNAQFTCGAFATTVVCSIIFDDASGVIYLTGSYYAQLRRITINGGVGTVTSYASPGSEPTGLALLGGVLYVVVSGYMIRTFPLSTQVLTTVGGANRGAGDGDFWVAGLNVVGGSIAADAVNGTLYLPDMANHKIRVFNTATRIMTTPAGGGLGTAWRTPSRTSRFGTPVVAKY